MKTVIVDSLPTAKFGYSAIRCPGVIISFTDSSLANSGLILEWHWDFGDGSPIDSISVNPTHVYSLAGTFNVILQLLGQDGCTEADTLLIHINSKPVAAFHASNTCEDSLVMLTDSSYNSVGP